MGQEGLQVLLLLMISTTSRKDLHWRRSSAYTAGRNMCLSSKVRVQRSSRDMGSRPLQHRRDPLEKDCDQTKEVSRSKGRMSWAMMMGILGKVHERDVRR